ncbi:NAD(P)H-dependent oxidoreductase [Algoriphagus boritolerans]|uniref:Flavodoxin-like fold n=1 Tax=Algoriphagus boritolerans DSM 17298 = JCM 18970 TaxID=1120964 RepID=A0A1H6APU0_9BACT|nr:NAD(P)H-dependent oxidoreductase [Algoriphagus boritolerans]SEG50728.1 Flavodoxin-like fold [Algoriphagus boritolerans DSM 17298 = JCM 18970]
MNLLIVYAHPETTSLNGYLKDFAQNYLIKLGRDVLVSDLYQMNRKAVANKDDFNNLDPNSKLDYMKESRLAYQNNTQADDSTKEQETIIWASLPHK